MKTKSKSNKKVSIKKLVLSSLFIAIFLLSLVPVCSNLTVSHSTLVCERAGQNDRIDLRNIKS